MSRRAVTLGDVDTDTSAGTRRTNAVRAGALLALLVGTLLTLRGLLLGLHFESTPQALEEAAKGQAVGYPAALGAVLALVALLGGRRRWAVAAVVASAALCALALVMELTR